MTISPSLSASLEAVAAILAPARDPWWIIASAAVALHGADPGDVADVDVLISANDARRILPTLGLKPRRGAAHASFRSGIFCPWRGTALPVEFMADFAYRSGGEWRPVLPATRQKIDGNGWSVFVPDRSELQIMLSGFGRPKDIARVRSLAALG